MVSGFLVDHIEAVDEAAHKGIPASWLDVFLGKTDLTPKKESTNKRGLKKIWIKLRNKRPPVFEDLV